MAKRKRPEAKSVNPKWKDIWAIPNMIDRVLDHSLGMEDKHVARRAILDAVEIMESEENSETFEKFAVACERAAAGFLRLAWAARNAADRTSAPK